MDDSTPMKVCSKCKQPYPCTAEYFHRDKKQKDGLRPICKDCLRIQQGRKKHVDYSKGALDGYKFCSECGNQFPETKEYFQIHVTGKNGLRNKCRACSRKQRNQYNNRPYVKQKHKEYSDAHKEERSVKNKERRVKKLAENPNYNKEHYERYGKTDKRKRYMQDYTKQYNQLPSVKEKARERSAKRRLSPEVRQKEIDYRRSPQGIANQKVRKQRRRARIKNAPGHFTAADVQKQYRSQHGKCWWCGCELGDNYHADHLIPLAKGGSNWPNNIVCSCPKCNISRQDKMPHEWSDRLL